MAAKLLPRGKATGADLWQLTPVIKSTAMGL